MGNEGIIWVSEADRLLAARVADSIRPSLRDRLITAIGADNADNEDFGENAVIVTLYLMLMDDKIKEIDAHIDNAG